MTLSMLLNERAPPLKANPKATVSAAHAIRSSVTSFFVKLYV